MISVDEAVNFMIERHGDQKRKQGTPYYTHPLAVSKLLKKKGFNESYQIAGLFHDLIEDTETTYDEILNLTNFEIATAVRLVTKEPGYVMSTYMDRISKNHMAKMVKLADRIHNVSELVDTNIEFVNRYLDETESYLVPLSEGTQFEKDLKDEILKVKQTFNLL